jgi:hypothetical protein
MTGLSTDLQFLLNRRSAIFTQLNSLSAGAAGYGPNTSGEGISVDQQGYRLSLFKELEYINKQISLVGGPYEYSTHGRV